MDRPDGYTNQGDPFELKTTSRCLNPHCGAADAESLCANCARLTELAKDPILAELSRQLDQDYKIPLWRLWVALVLLVATTLAGCGLIFRWTATQPQDQPFSQPLRTRPPR